MAKIIDKYTSIKKRRIIYKFSWSLIFEKLINSFYYFLWIICSILLYTNKSNHFSLLGITIHLLFTFWFLSGWFFINKLVKFEIKDMTINRSVFFEKLSYGFPNLDIQDSGNEKIIIRKETGLFTWGKILIIIFDTQQAYVNYTTVGRHDLYSPFHSLANYIKLKKLRSEFEYLVS